MVTVSVSTGVAFLSTLTLTVAADERRPLLTITWNESVYGSFVFGGAGGATN